MTMQELTAGIAGCSCGRTHTCPIRFVHIGSGALKQLPEVCLPYRHILLVADTNTYAVCGADVSHLLEDKLDATLILESDSVVVPNEACLARVEQELGETADLIVGIGSGVINDICKDVSYRHGLPYAIVATAPSMDGYASVGAALILGGMKITRNARPPMAIVADTAVLCTAPLPMVASGIRRYYGKIFLFERLATEYGHLRGILLQASIRCNHGQRSCGGTVGRAHFSA